MNTPLQRLTTPPAETAEPRRPWVYWFRHSIRGRLTLTVALVHAVLMLALVADVMWRQQQTLLEQQTALAENMSRTLATSGAGWLAARDLAGLQELVAEQKNLPEVDFAMLLDTQGKVLAHSDAQRVGQMVQDMPTEATHQVLARHAMRVDVATPARLGDVHVGWARVGVNQKQAREKLDRLVRNGLLYAAFAVVLGSALAWAVARQLTRSLYAIRTTAQRVEAGDAQARVPPLGKDEVGEVGLHFNRMLATLDERARELLSAQQGLYEEKEQAQVTLASIGDGVVTTDAAGCVTFMNPVAENLTGWRSTEAEGQHITRVMQLRHENSGDQVENPVERCIREGIVVAMANHTELTNRQGVRRAVEDSAAPIRNAQGELLGVVMVCRDVSEQRALSREMAWQVTHDALTGLTNRREFERRTQDLIQRTQLQTTESGVDPARLSQTQHALLFLDLDQFKVVNDTCGHLAGDELLRQISQRLATVLRGNDLLARLGGDEFGVLLERSSLEIARDVAEKLLQNVRDMDFSWEGKRFQVGVSIGVAPIGAFTRSLAEVTASADMACYAAKEGGRNRVHVHAPQDQALAQRLKELQAASDIRTALQQDRLVLHCQEIRPIARDGVHPGHHEVLLRMRAVDGQLMLPSTFIPSAERYGLMADVDRWVVQQAFQALAQAPHLHLAINLSGLSVQDETFADFIRQASASSGIPCGHVCFEITETAAISHLDKVIALMSQLRALGFSFALDDFGSGMSSFNYLKNLPVDYLKIDGAFVRDMVSDPIDRAFVETINHIGHVMGMATIAEFVESEAILAELQRIGVDYAQGYVIHKPSPLSELLEPGS